tara:strand:- start:338 stop:757 length:420 start_codon:yes stop_codon:yes gene_type:complete
MSNFGTDKIIGFTNGCFDILHVGHIQMLEYIKKNCDHLVVGIDSDRRVKENKGSDRPINTEDDRAYMLQSLRYVDAVFIFDSDDELTQLVKEIAPDLMVVGSDYKNKRVIGGEHAKNVLFFERIDGFSTTKIIQCSALR